MRFEIKSFFKSQEKKTMGHYSLITWHSTQFGLLTAQFITRQAISIT